jgi:hypothetical protein
MRVHIRVKAPCWPIRASSWNQISIGLPWAVTGRPSFASPEIFLRGLLRRLVGLRVARAHRQARELEPLEKPSHMAFGDVHVETPETVRYLV